MDGSATFKMLTSSRVMNSADAQAARAGHRRGARSVSPLGTSRSCAPILRVAHDIPWPARVHRGRGHTRPVNDRSREESAVGRMEPPVDPAGPLPGGHGAVAAWRRPTVAENRWPSVGAIALAIALQWLVPDTLGLHPRRVLPTVRLR